MHGMHACMRDQLAVHATFVAPACCVHHHRLWTPAAAALCVMGINDTPYPPSPLLQPPQQPQTTTTTAPQAAPSSTSPHYNTAQRQLPTTGSSGPYSSVTPHDSSTALTDSADRPSIAVLTLALEKRGTGCSPIAATSHGPHHTLAWLSLINKWKYCSLHGYSFVPVMWTEYTEYHPVWVKIPEIQKQLQHHDWVWLMDMDAFITNMDLNIEEHIFKQVRHKWF
jgi:hypothetical protein